MHLLKDTNMKIRLAIFDVEENRWLMRTNLHEDEIINCLKSLRKINHQQWFNDTSEIYEIKYHLIANKICEYVVIIQSSDKHNIIFDRIDHLLSNHYSVKTIFNSCN